MAFAGFLEGKTLVDRGHVAVHADYDEEADEWALGIHLGGHDDTVPPVPADEVILVVNPSGHLEVPELSEDWSFLGEEGDSVWIIPAGTAPSDLVRLGFNQFGIDDGVFAGASGGMITQTLIGIDGPDEFFMYSSSGGQPAIIYDSRLESPPYGAVTNLDAGGHRHYNWAFRSRGIYFLTLQASGTLASNGSDTFSEPATFSFLVDPLPIHWWFLEHFGFEANEPVAALDADPDGDGIVNLLEYAFDLDPISPGRKGLPRVEPRETDGEIHLWISYRQPEGRSDIAYLVEVANDPGGWEPLEEKEAVTEWSTDDDGIPVISVRDAISLEAGDVRRFLRVRVVWLEEEGA